MIAEIPSIWRDEVWHPLTVHLPVATLLLSSVAAIISLVVRNKSYLFLTQLIYVMLAIGVVSGWIAIYTGEVAYNIEVRKICDPKVLQDHQWWSYTTMIVYSIVLGLKTLSKFIFPNLAHVIKTISSALIIAALLGLLYTGHLGASLVYQQGAGTYKPSSDCSEFVQ